MPLTEKKREDAEGHSTFSAMILACDSLKS